MNDVTLFKTHWFTMLILVVALLPLHQLAYAIESNDVKSITKLQNFELVKQKAHEFLSTETQSAPGKVIIHIGEVDKRLKLEECAAMEAFLPSGSKAWGKTTVGVHCGAPSTWTLYLQAKVSIFAGYLAAARPMSQGQQLSSQDIMLLQGDLTTLPTGVMTNPDEVLGRIMSSAISSGTVFRQDLLKSPIVISQGQTVRVTSSGKGFSVSTDAQALASANEGQVVRAKTLNGAIITGIARQGGNVVINF